VTPEWGRATPQSESEGFASQASVPPNTARPSFEITALTTTNAPPILR
jgi:hypothetical protein